jgi:FecR protein
MRKSSGTTFIAGLLILVVVFSFGIQASARAAARGEGVSPDQLPEELNALAVQQQFIPGQGAPVGKVLEVRGHVIVHNGNAPEGYFALQGDSLYAHDEVFTLDKTRTRIRLTTADIVNVGADSRIRLDELVDDRSNRLKKTRMTMLRGKAMFYVMRLMKYNEVDTAISTPNAVCGVRGTKFAVIVRKKTDLRSERPLYLVDNGDNGPETVMIMVEGRGYMRAGGTTTQLSTGQTATAGPSGPPVARPTRPGLDQGLTRATDPYAGDRGNGGGDRDVDTGDDPNAAWELGDSGTDTISSVTQQGLVGSRPTRRIGYFASLLTRFSYYGSPISPTPDHVYVSDSAHDHEASGIVGADVTSGIDIIQLDGSAGNAPTVTAFDSETGTSLTTANGLGPEHKIQTTEIGHNQFLEWGYWVMPTRMIHSSGVVGTWGMENAGVYVHGDPTPVENLNGIRGHYAGTAWGTLWSSAGGAKLSGTMSADVTLGSRALQNLNVSVSGGGNTVSIVQQSNTFFSGPDGEFSLQQHWGSGNADFRINGSAADHGVVTGGLFGPNGEALAGAAGVVQGALNAVVGFEGTK